MLRRLTITLSLLAGLLLTGLPAQATVLEKLGLGDLTSRADTIFRGTVVDIEQGTIAAGGGELPVVTYRLRVEEMIKGEADIVKGDAKAMEIRMVGSIKNEEVREDGLVRLSAFRDVPKLNQGSDYVLFMTPRSDIGLSVTVGLGQGAFGIVTTTKEDMAMNAYNNAGLGLGEGPVSYDDLKTAITAAMGQ